MKLPLCRHIKTNGLQCESAALNEGLYCYFHTRLYARHSPFRFPPTAPGLPARQVQLEPLEDSESIQVALSVVVNALANGALEPQRANAILYGLSLASINVRRIRSIPLPYRVVRTVDQSPEGLDLAQTGATCNT